jgi:hypothetical protein
MIEGSLLFDLRQSGAVARTPQTSLPDTISAFRESNLRAINLPNSSISTDFLVGKGNLWVGVTVGLAQSDFSFVKDMFGSCNPSLVRMIPPHRSPALDRYKKYSGWGWLEVLWTETEAVELVEIQTNGVLWYVPTAAPTRITVMALEDVASLASEAPGSLQLPDAFSGTEHRNQ